MKTSSTMKMISKWGQPKKRRQSKNQDELKNQDCTKPKLNNLSCAYLLIDQHLGQDKLRLISDRKKNKNPLFYKIK